MDKKDKESMETKVFGTYIKSAIQNSLVNFSDVLVDYQKEIISNSLSYIKDDLVRLTNEIMQSYLIYNKEILIDLVKNIRSLIANDTLIKSLSETFQEVYTDVYIKESIQNVADSYSDLLPYYSKILSQIGSISDDEFDSLLEGTEFTKDDVIEDIRLVNEELSRNFSQEEFTQSHQIYLQRKINELFQKHPALAHIFFCINIIISTLSGSDIINDTLLPEIQNAIVSVQGNEDIFFIKVESAKLYVEASSHANVITKIPYGEQVTLIKSTKMWDKVFYINDSNEKFIGWIAKRNLMSYRDYEFNSENLYDL